MAVDIEIKRYLEALHVKVITGATERKEAYIDIVDVRSVCLVAFDPNVVQIVFTDGSQKNIDYTAVSKVDADTTIDSTSELFILLWQWRFPTLTAL